MNSFDAVIYCKVFYKLSRWVTACSIITTAAKTPCTLSQYGRTGIVYCAADEHVLLSIPPAYLII